MKKRILSFLMVICMMFSQVSVMAYAEGSSETVGTETIKTGLCEHHTTHDERCGYVEAVEGSQCTHEHSETCYQTLHCVHEHNEECEFGENCEHECTIESGCITICDECQHIHDENCGYVDTVSESDCGYVCEICNAVKEPEQTAVEKVQAMIDALPDAESVTEENRASVEADLDMIDEAKCKLSDAERAELNFTKYDAIIVVLSENDNAKIISDEKIYYVESKEQFKTAVDEISIMYRKGTITITNNIICEELSTSPDMEITLIVNEGSRLEINTALSNDGTLIIKGGGELSLSGNYSENRGTIIDEEGILYVNVNNFQNDGVIKSTSSNVSNINSVRRQRTISVMAGENMTIASGSSSQTVWQGDAISSVVFTANDGYFFPTDYASKVTGMASGISVTRDSATQITISGTLAIDGDDVNISLPGIYTITYDLDGGILSSSNLDFYTSETETFKLNNPTREGYEFIGWSGTDIADIDKEVYILHGSTGNRVYTANWKDITLPTGEISIKTNKWSAFLNNITFNIFFKDTQNVTITATDNSGEDVTIEYLLSDKELSETELANKAFTAYTGKFTVEPNNEYVIYAKLTDKTGNVAYINSNGIVLDNIAPVIIGIEDGKIYCSDRTVTVTEENIATVTLNGANIIGILDENNKFTLSPAPGKQTIVVTDKAGNKAVVAVTINNGHYETEIRNDKNATCTEDGYTGDTCCKYCGEKLSAGTSITKLGHIDENKDHVCDRESCKATISAHSGGTATCTDKAVCDYCGDEYGEVDSSNHTGGTEVRNAKEATCTEDGYTGDIYCKGCGKKLSDGKSVTKTGHDYESKVTKEATTTSIGTKTYTCKNCGHSYEEKIAKLSSQSTYPKTGDETPLVATIVVTFLSAAVLIGLVTYKKRGRYSAK